MDILSSSSAVTSKNTHTQHTITYEYSHEKLLLGNLVGQEVSCVTGFKIEVEIEGFDSTTRTTFP